jgi:hypothetical protein
MHRETRQVFQKLIARDRSVRICRIDEYGTPSYVCRFGKKNGQCGGEHLAVCDGDNNWVMVKPRKKQP